MRGGFLIALLGGLLVAAGDARAAPEVDRFDTSAFARDGRRIRVGTTRKRVRRLLGEPDDTSDGVWTYHNPPNRPDGPFDVFRFTFVKDKVSKVEEAGVGCVYRELRE